MTHYDDYFKKSLELKEKCLCCNQNLTFGTMSNMSKAYTNPNWYCGNCGAYVSELVYGKNFKN